ncbi:MAG: polyribonucleotide nucleotidyltransferase, partial [Acidobacteriota bacterium]
MSEHRLEIDLGGRPLVVETGEMARQAGGSVTVRQGDSVVLVAATASKSPREVPFLPLTVDYREAMYAAGKVPGGFFKREGRPNEKETLSSRLIDRPLRPLFPTGWNFETQVIAMVLSADKENNPDVLALTGASFALNLSDIPFPHPIAAVRVGLIDGDYVINPLNSQLSDSRLDLIVAARDEAIVMVEAGANEASEEEVIGALFAGQEAVRPVIAAQRRWAEELGQPKREFKPREIPEHVLAETREKLRQPLLEAMQIQGKLLSYARVDALLEQRLAEIPEDDAEQAFWVREAFFALQDEILHDYLIDNGRRLDGRRFDEIRKVTCQVGTLPRTHGSALFTRGETQALVTTTLGTSSDTQRIEWLEFEGEKRFMLHYNFPPFSVGEVRFLRGPGRREIGHGALAERALRPVITGEDSIPYTIRDVSDLLESNGSSSMASVCGGSLALMDSGVPVTKAVAGIAMGLVKKEERLAVLTDIAGAEDHHGDMDFKVTGTRDGITALQMDIKIGGITRKIMEQALTQARRARLELLEMMNRALPEPRDDFSRYAPRILTIFVPKDKIREVIGPGGKVIRSIQERTGTEI